MASLPGPVARELGGLALSVVRTDNPLAVLRAAHWRNALTRVGLGVPFWVVHDVGLAAVIDPGSVPIGPRPSAGDQAPQHLREIETWAQTVREIAESEVLEKARAWRLSDELLSVLLLRVLGPIWERHRGPGRRLLPPLCPWIQRPTAISSLDFQISLRAQTVPRISHFSSTWPPTTCACSSG